MSAKRIAMELALHDDTPHRSILVSRDGLEGLCVSLPRAEINWRPLRGRFETTPRGRKLQIIEVTMPEWLATARGLT